MMGEVATTAELHLEGEAAGLALLLAELRGVSVPDAVADALRRGIEREREVRTRTGRILELAAEIRAHMTPPLPSSDHSWLYDENGLPV